MGELQKHRRCLLVGSIAASFSIILGIVVLLSSLGWLSSGGHWGAVCCIGAGGLGLISIALYRETYKSYLSEPNFEKAQEIREQIIDIIVTRAKRFSLLVAIVTVLGIGGYFEVTFKPLLEQVRTAKSDLEEIHKQRKEIDSIYAIVAEKAQVLPQQFALIDRLDEKVNALQTVVDKRLPETENALRIFAESDRQFKELRENQNYKINIRYTGEFTSKAFSVGHSLNVAGFSVSYEDISNKKQFFFSENMKLTYYSGDMRKFNVVERLLQQQNVRIMPNPIDEYHQVKVFTLWLLDPTSNK